MLRKNSIFIKIFIPAVIVVLLQTSIVGLTLFINGTIEALDESAVATLSQNMENRAASLENMMVSYWSNLDKLELDVTTHIESYLVEYALDIDDVRGDYLHETALLRSIRGSLINTLRTSISTGVFVYFLDAAGYSEGEHICNGLYYRDLDPFTNQGDNSDLIFERGHIDTAREDRIQLGSLWSEAFTFTPENADTWRGFANPQIAAEGFPDAAPIDLAYWNRPHFLNPGSSLDSNESITYTRPFFYQDQLIAMIGTEVQMTQLEKSFPASDFDSLGQAGYMLLEFGETSNGQNSFSANVYQVTGSYIKQLIDQGSEILLTDADESGSYHIGAPDMDETRVVIQPLRLYNTNAPFVEERWALAAISTENMLFRSSRNVSGGVILGSLLAMLAGGIFLVFAIRRSTDPLISVVSQIEKSGYDDRAIFSSSNTYEISLLVSTINAMRERRNLAEVQVHEERERYLVALESTTDTFMEYDIPADSFILYYFSESESTGTGTRLSAHTIPHFMETIVDQGFCHPEDIGKVTRFMQSTEMKPIEVRARVSVFSHIKDVTPDGEYYWFLLKASTIHGNDGSVIKIIGTAKEITHDKLEEYAAIEVRRRDMTTGLFDAAYGTDLIRSRLADAVCEGISSVVSVLHAEDFDQVEAYYGRVFGGIVMSGIGWVLTGTAPCGVTIARLKNDDFLMLSTDMPREALIRFGEQVAREVRGLYTGENTEIKMNMRMGTVVAKGGEDLDMLISRANAALRYAEHRDRDVLFFDDIPSEEVIKTVTARSKPVNVFLNTGLENIVSLTFELFERTQDVHSATKVLLCLLGRLIVFRRISVCVYDAGFGTNQVLYEWKNGSVQTGGGIEKIAYQDFIDFDALLDENGTLLFTGEDFKSYSEGVRKLLCLTSGSDQEGCCYGMFENTTHTGRILFFGQEKDWTEEIKQTLYEVVKIIAAHMSIEKFHSASRAKSEFFSRISHEIRTPMNVILGMTDIALKSGEDTVRVTDALNKIHFSAKHLLTLINDVLDMSRIESGRLQIECAPFSLEDFIAGIDTLMRTPIENNGITFIINRDFRHAEVTGDAYRLRQVLVNLLGNAGKFTNAGGIVIFSVEEPENPIGADQENTASFRFSVKDTGIGISVEEQLQVFQAFEQAGSSEKRHSGTGLGLAISSSIISAMGSKIELTSKPGEGSEFYFTVRLGLDGGRTDIAETNRPVWNYQDCFVGKRALLVEDVDLNAEIASFILEETGIAIDIAVNGQEAVDRFFASPAGYYDVILMDIQMPVMDGLTAARRIRSTTGRSDASTVPIIAMTANAFDEDMKKSVESGMNGHVAKPLEGEKMLALLYQILLMETVPM